MTRTARGLELRVGLFLVVSLVLAGLLIFAVGNKRGLFERKTTIYVYFDDVSGLVPGATVRLSGLDVGTVADIQFPEQLERLNARVTLSIKSKYMERVRRDSAARIDSKGLLGDKIVNISVGTPKSPALRDGDVLQARRSTTIEDLTEKLDQAVSSVTDIIASLAEEGARADVASIIASTASILSEVQHGKGLAHRLFYDPTYGDQLSGLLRESEALLVAFRSATKRVDRAIAAIEEGDGALHELLYGEHGKLLVQELRTTSTEIGAIAREVRTGDGMLHALIFGPEGTRALAQLDQAATRINRITAEIEQGRGTLGGLLVDPSVYEDLKSVLGNVERNVLFKALVRFTIKRGDIERPANIKAQPLEK